MIERRKSKIDGWGVYATQTIPKNKRIIHYAGEKISNTESLKRERKYMQKGHIWCFKLTNRSVIDAGVGGNDARFIQLYGGSSGPAFGVWFGLVKSEDLYNVNPGQTGLVYSLPLGTLYS